MKELAVLLLYVSAMLLVVMLFRKWHAPRSLYYGALPVLNIMLCFGLVWSNGNIYLGAFLPVALVGAFGGLIGAWVLTHYLPR
jgi:hypothetical protein